MSSTNTPNPSSQISESQKKAHIKAIHQGLMLTADGSYNNDVYHEFTP